MSTIFPPAPTAQAWSWSTASIPPRAFGPPGAPIDTQPVASVEQLVGQYQIWPFAPAAQTSEFCVETEVRTVEPSPGGVTFFQTELVAPLPVVGLLHLAEQAQIAPEPTA